MPKNCKEVKIKEANKKPLAIPIITPPITSKRCGPETLSTILIKMHIILKKIAVPITNIIKATFLATPALSNVLSDKNCPNLL